MSQNSEPTSDRGRTALAIADPYFQRITIAGSVISYFIFTFLALYFAYIGIRTLAFLFAFASQISLIAAVISLMLRKVLQNDELLAHLRGQDEFSLEG